MSDPFYVTTPIYYVNDEPHLGHAYTTVLGDVLARYARLRGRETFFLTGADEHGQKVQTAARQRGVEPAAYVDQMVLRFKETWRALHVSHDDFIRTTEPRHVRVVEHVLQALWQQGDIYRADYEGWYCVPDERFWTEKDLLAGRCPDCGRPVERLVEPNFFFRMSRYQEWLIDHIEQQPAFIRPETRRNEVIGFLRRPLADLCISRPASRLSWGIPLPFDRDFVTYVWFDALLNYVTAAGYLDDPDRFGRLWPQAMHLIGKDILITHAVYWPTMLRAAGLPPPRTIFAHGWWVVGGDKMGKSLGNAVPPLELARLVGADAFRFFLVREMAPGRDAEFSLDGLLARYQADLANNLGNLLHRLVDMIGRYHGGLVPAPTAAGPAEAALQARLLALPAATFERVDAVAPNEAVALVMDGLGAINGYLERSAPWLLARDGHTGRVATVLYTALEGLRLASLLLHPVMPIQMAGLWRRIGWQPPKALVGGLEWGLLPPGSPVTAGPPLFPRQLALPEQAVPERR